MANSNQKFVSVSLTRKQIADHLNETAVDFPSFVKFEPGDDRLTVDFCTWYAQEYGKFVGYEDDLCDLVFKALRKLGFSKQVRDYLEL